MILSADGVAAYVRRLQQHGHLALPIFVPFSPYIIKYALENYRPQPYALFTGRDESYPDALYRRLGYKTIGTTAIWPPKPKPWER